MFLGQIAGARRTQVVNPKYTCICKVEKELGAVARSVEIA